MVQVLLDLVVLIIPVQCPIRLSHTHTQNTTLSIREYEEQADQEFLDLVLVLVSGQYGPPNEYQILVCSLNWSKEVPK